MEKLPKWAMPVLFFLACLTSIVGAVSWFMIAWAAVAFVRGS